MRSFLLGIVLLYCAAATASTNNCSLIRADFDGNGIINFLDVALFNSCFLTNTSDTPTCSFADLDASGSVNFLDYSILTANFLETVPTDLPGSWLQNRIPSVATFGSDPFTVTVTDINGDGLTDTIGIPMFPTVDSELFVAMNLGNYQFSDPISWGPLQAYGSRWRFGDYNGDGILDVASFRTSTSIIQINLLDPITQSTTSVEKQLFTEPQDDRVISTHRYVDISGDGHVDIVGTYKDQGASSGFNQPQGFFVFESLSSGVWQDTPIIVALNLPEDPPDQRYDLLGAIVELPQESPLASALLVSAVVSTPIAQRALLMLDKRSGQYEINTLSLGSNALLDRLIYVEDFDGDGNNDVLYTKAETGNDAYWLFSGANTGTGFLPPVSVDFTAFGKLLPPIKDVDGQVYLPLAIESLPGMVLGTLDQQGVLDELASVKAHADITDTYASQSIEPHRLTLALVDSSSYSYVAYLDELLTGEELPVPQVFGMPVEGFKLSADLDGDFDPDVVTTTGNLIVNDDGVFTVLQNQLALDASAQVRVSDINQDGKPDVVSFSFVTRDLVSYLGAGDMTFTEASHLQISGSSSFTGLADINGDTIPDAMFGGNRYRPGDGLGGFLAPAFTGVSTFASAIDFNNDGVADLLERKTFPNRYDIHLNQGNGAFASPVTYTVPYANDHGFSSDSVLAIDFNADGITDLISYIGTAFPGADEIVISLGNGDGTFTVTEQVTDRPTLSRIGTPIGTRDINRDGLQDLIGTYSYSNNIIVVPNSENGLLLGEVHNYASNIAVNGSQLLLNDFTDSCTVDFISINNNELFLYSNPSISE